MTTYTRHFFHLIVYVYFTRIQKVFQLKMLYTFETFEYQLFLFLNGKLLTHRD